MKIVKKEVVVETRTDIVVELDDNDRNKIQMIIKDGWRAYKYVCPPTAPMITTVTELINRAFNQGRYYERCH